MICLIILSLVVVKYSSSEKLWCYQCNTELSLGHRAECNDPYAPGPSIDLVSCPKNEPHHCLKAFILYKNIHATVRACVPTRTRSTYCAFRDVYPEAHVSCTFCNENGCNRSSPGFYSAFENKLMIIGLFILVFAINFCLV